MKGSKGRLVAYEEQFSVDGCRFTVQMAASRSHLSDRQRQGAAGGQTYTFHFLENSGVILSGHSGDIYEQAVVKTVAGFLRGNSTHLFGVTRKSTSSRVVCLSLPHQTGSGRAAEFQGWQSVKGSKGRLRSRSRGSRLKRRLSVRRPVVGSQWLVVGGGDCRVATLLAMK